MWRYRLKVTLLVLGVVLGYGSALRHHGYGLGLGHGRCGNHGHAESCPWSMHDGARPDHAPSEKPGKPVQ